jgi:hypothetical protein
VQGEARESLDQHLTRIEGVDKVGTRDVIGQLQDAAQEKSDAEQDLLRQQNREPEPEQLREKLSDVERQRDELSKQDAMVEQFLSTDNTATVDGHRRLRSVVLINEARQILRQTKLDSLSRLVCEGAIKGLVVLLFFRDLSGFGGRSDDPTTQLGTAIAYGCNATDRGLRALSRAYGRKLQPQDIADLNPGQGVTRCKLPARPAERIHAWQPR